MSILYLIFNFFPVEALGGKALPCIVDVREEKQIQKAIDEAIKKVTDLRISGVIIFQLSSLYLQYYLQHCHYDLPIVLLETVACVINIKFLHKDDYLHLSCFKRKNKTWIPCCLSFDHTIISTKQVRVKVVKRGVLDII